MINYIRHDEQFFAALKLNTGEEVLGEVLISEDPDTKKDMIFIQNPAKTKVIELPDSDDESVRNHKVAMGLIRWMNFSDEDFYVLDESAIISIAPMSKEAVMMYKRWIRKEIKQEETEESEVPMNENMGLVAKVEDARKLLEKLFSEPPHYH